MVAHSANDVLGSVRITDDTGQRFLNFGQVWRAAFQEAHACSGVVARGSDRVEKFMSQRGGQLTIMLTRFMCARSDSSCPKSLMSNT